MGRVLKLMGAETGEESLISLLLIQSVFIGIFLGAFDITAHSVFLSVFDEKMMARGYVLSGITGIALTMLYRWLQGKTRSGSISILNLAFVSAITMVTWILLISVHSNWVIWLLFIVMGPLNLTAVLGLRGTAGKLSVQKPGKRVPGWTDAGLITGIILISCSIPILLSLNFRPQNILLIGATTVLAGCIIQIMIGTRIKFLNFNINSESEVKYPPDSLISVFRKKRFIKLMVLYITLSVIAAFFVQYSFMAVARIQYPTVTEMARFLGFFTGTMMLVTLLVKLFIFPLINRNYGLRASLTLAPLLVASFALITLALGILKGYTPAAGLGFTVFFIILALNRLFSRSLRESVEYPSLKVVYQALSEKDKRHLQPSAEGTVNESAVLFSGLILAGLGLLSFIKLIHFSLILVLIAALWILVAFMLYSGFRHSIKKTSEPASEDMPGSQNLLLNVNYNSRFSAILDFKNDYFNLISGKLDCLKNRAAQYYNVFIEAAEYEKDINLVPALKKTASDTMLDEGLRQRFRKTAESLELFSAAFVQKDDKLFSANRILAESRVPQTTHILRLLRDKSLSSKRAAIFMIGKFRMKDMIPELCGCLNIPELEHQAENVLKSFGSEAAEELRRFSLISSGNLKISKTILRLLAVSNTIENRGFLFERLWSASRQIKEFALERLIDTGFTPAPEEKLILHQLIRDTIGIMLWNLSARICLKEQNDTFLLEALEKEIRRWNKYFFNLLSVTYDASLIRVIREKLEEGSAEGTCFAREMIDMVIDDQLKTLILPLLNDTSEEEKVLQMFRFFPGEIPEYNKLLEDILNRDYNFVGIFIRACVLRNMKETGSESMGESVISLLFNPEVILQEEAAGLLARAGSNLYIKASSRLPQNTRDRIDRIAGGDAVKESMVYEKSKFLSACFEGLEEEDLLSLAGSMSFTEKSMKRTLPGRGGYLLWDCTDSNVIIVYNPDIITGLTYVLPLTELEEYCNHFPEKAGIILNYIEKNRT